ncbi:MAG: porin [bacterium]|nr:porin [bacterium]
MTLHCKIGQSPKVIYKFKDDKSDRVYLLQVSPVDVSTSPDEDPNIKGETYAWNFSTSLNPRTTLEQMPFRAKGKLTNFKVDSLINTDIVNGVTIGNWRCSFKDGNGNMAFGSAVGYYPNDKPTLAKMLVPGEKPPDDICQIKIKDATGKLLFSESGKCPCNYQVACEGCPPGSNKCTHKGYPGYCCIPCKQTGDRLQNMANKVGR